MRIIREPRSNGELTHVDIHIDGKRRAVALSREVIEDRLGVESLSADEQCEFVVSHLPEVVAAVRRKIGVTSETADVVVIRSGEL